MPHLSPLQSSLEISALFLFLRPDDSLLARIQRFAVREFGRDPALPFDEFQQRLGKHFFGENATAEATEDLLELQRIFTFESTWYWSSPLLDPPFFVDRAKRLDWPKSKLEEYARNLDRLRAIARKYQNARYPTEQELAKLAQHVVDAWGERSP